MIRKILIISLVIGGFACTQKQPEKESKKTYSNSERSCLEDNEFDLPVRGVYHLSCWGYTHQLSLDQLKHIFDVYKDMGINEIYFWMPGLFRSGLYPESNIYPDGGVDNNGLRELIDYAHSKEMKFIMLSGVFCWPGIDEMIISHPETEGEVTGIYFQKTYWNETQCPSVPKTREVTFNYIVEMIDSFPQADGFFMEFQDEKGGCWCERCRLPSPDPNTCQFSHAKYTFADSLIQHIWKEKPDFIFGLCAGYLGCENYAWDGDFKDRKEAAFYEWLAEFNGDERIRIMNARYAYAYYDTKDSLLPFLDISDFILGFPRKVVATAKEKLKEFSESSKFQTGGHCFVYSTSYWNWNRETPLDFLAVGLERFAVTPGRLAFKAYAHDTTVSYEELKDLMFCELFYPNTDTILIDKFENLHRHFIHLYEYEKKKAIQDIEIYRRAELSPKYYLYKNLLSYAKLCKDDIQEIESYLNSNEFKPCQGIDMMKEGLALCTRVANDAFIKKLEYTIIHLEHKFEKGYSERPEYIATE